MDRPIIYTQEQARSTDFLFGARSGMVGLAKLAEALLGSSTLVSGLSVGANSPAALNVIVQPGQVYALANIDATAYGVLAADTTHNVLKQGVSLNATTLSCAAPITVGYSINYLIEAAFAETDTTPAVLPYFNSANPAQPLSGQSNSGASQATERQGVVSLIAKAGAAATTGTQTTPTADAGYVGLAVVTVAYGQTTITAGNIAAVVGAPIISETLTQKIGLVTGDARYAALAGLATQLFSVAAGTTTNHAVNLGQFITGQVKSAPVSNQPLPGGLIIKTGLASGLLSASTNTITYPVAFPNATLLALSVPQLGGAAAQAANLTNTYAAGSFVLVNNGTVTQNHAWIAIGY